MPQSTSFTLGLDLIRQTNIIRLVSGSREDLDYEAQRVSVRLHQLRSQREILIISDNLKQGVEQTYQCHIIELRNIRPDLRHN